jgi:glycerol-3-phosphate acyltransferase PlsY
MLVGVPLIAVTRYVSLGSVSAAVLGCLSLIIMSTLGHLPLSYIWFGAIGSVLVVVRHRENIQRLLSGTERKLGQRAEAAS